MEFIRKLIFRLRAEVTTKTLIKRGLIIGNNFERNEGCIIDPSHCWLIKIGDNVTLAPRVHILAHDASMKNQLGYTKIGHVIIGNNVFIGAGAIILPGVQIGNNVVVGAGSIVTHSIDDNSVVIGNPAHVVSNYSDFISKHKKNISVSPKFDEEYTLRNPKITQEKKDEMKDKLANCIGYVK